MQRCSPGRTMIGGLALLRRFAVPSFASGAVMFALVAALTLTPALRFLYLSTFVRAFGSAVLLCPLLTVLVMLLLFDVVVVHCELIEPLEDLTYHSRRTARFESVRRRPRACPHAEAAIASWPTYGTSGADRHGICQSRRAYSHRPAADSSSRRNNSNSGAARNAFRPNATRSSTVRRGNPKLVGNSEK